MSKRVALILALIAAAGVMITMIPSAVNSRLAARLQVTAEPGSLAWYAQTALAQGLAAYNFSAGVGEYPLPTWDNAVSNSSVVVAQLIDAKSYPSGYAVNNQYVENSVIT